MAKKKRPKSYDGWPRQKVKVTELFLDPENIRLQLEVPTSQAALINDLFLNENAMQILDSIARNGFFPDELPVVVKETNKFIVIDGNRRVAALKVMHRPQLVPSKETEVKGILKTSQPLSKEINVVVAPDRVSVRHLLASKHTHNTMRPWRPLRQAYFYKAEIERGRTVQQLKSDFPEVDIDRFLRLINIHKIAKSIEYDDAQVGKKVHNDRSFPASTLARLYDDKRVQDFLGFEFGKDGEVRIKVVKSEFEKGFKKVVEDIVHRVIDSRKLNSEKNRSDYLKNFPESAIPKKKKGSKVLTSKDFKESEPVKSKRRKLAPKDIIFTMKAPGIFRMLSELQGIDHRKYPNAAHDLLRSFLECALKVYLKQMKITITPPKGRKFVYLDDVLKAFKLSMDTQRNKELSQVTQRIISNNNMTSYSAQFLNATNHNPSVFSTDKDVEEAWDAMDSLFRFILDPK